MTYMSVRELNANISKALADAETGEDLILTRNGRPFLRVTREGISDREAKREQALVSLRALIDRGIDFGGPATYEERTGR
jgi:antitoxin (DNA-binding transcriptional repressor) of toxin-antitoxin stability system